MDKLVYAYICRKGLKRTNRTKRKETRRAVKMKMSKLRKLTVMERLMRWRSWLRVTGISCSIYPRLPPVRNTSLWSFLVKWSIYNPHGVFITTILYKRTHTLCLSPCQLTLQRSTTAWKRSCGEMLLGQHQWKDVVAARLLSRRWGIWLLFLVRHV